MTNLSRKGRRMSFISVMKVAGALVSPKGMTVYS